MHTKTYFPLCVLTVTVGVSLYFHSFFCQIHSYPNFPESLVNDGLVLHDAHLDNAKRQRTLTAPMLKHEHHLSPHAQAGSARAGCPEQPPVGF